MSLFDHSGTWRPEHRADQQVRAMAFEIPPGVEAFRVELDHDHGDGAVLDLGCEGPAGYVGWSGGARSHYVVSEDWATPGYLPTRTDPGEWQVLLGLHRVPASGVTSRCA